MTTKKHLHERRGITFQELGALYATREMLRRGDLDHEADPYNDPELTGNHLFNMCHPGEVKNCGSIGCIGGTMAMVMGVDPDCYVVGRYFEGKVVRSRALEPLFFPSHSDSRGWGKITPKQAAKAIDNFLEYGKPFWRSCVTKSKWRKAKRK